MGSEQRRLTNKQWRHNLTVSQQITGLNIYILCRSTDRFHSKWKANLHLLRLENINAK